MRKRVGTGVLLALLVTVAAGCAKTPDVTETNPQHQSGTRLNEMPVTLHVYNTLGETVSMERAEEYIRRTMPNVTIESTYEIAPKMENAQLAAVRGGGGPEILYTQDYYTYVQNGYLKDLTSEPFLKNYMISALSDAEVGGKVYALPVGNGYISGLMVNQRLLTELGYELPRTQDEFVELCGRLQESREETGVRAYAFGMLYDERAALGAMPFFLDAYTDSAYVQWLSQYRRDPSAVSFQDPAFARVLQELEELKALGLCQSSDFLTSDSQNLQEVIRGDALMCSVSYVDFAVRFEDKLTEVNGVPSFRVAKDGRQIYVPAEDFVFIPYMGKTRGESWLATNGDWYLGINANVTDEATLQASRLYLEYVASTEFAPEYYSASVPAGATTYYRRDDALEYSFFQERHPEVYQCLTENSVIKNPYQFYGSSLFTFALRHYLCDQTYYAGLSGGSAYKDIGAAEDILAVLEDYRITGQNPYEVPDRVVGYTEKEYGYVRIYSRSNESALGNLLADAMREYTGADLAVVNAGALTAGLEAGEITESDLATAMLYGLSNHVVTVRCKGANLISILSTNNLVSTVRADQSGVYGGMVIPSGFTYTIAYEPVDGNEYGARAQIRDVRLANGEPLDPEAWYTVTTTDYELGGRDLWEAFTLIPAEKPGKLPDGIAIYRTFDPESGTASQVFDLNLDTYEEQYRQITDWAGEQPNIIDAVIAYIERHSENGVLAPVTTDGRIRIENMPERLDVEKNGVELR